MLLCTKSSLTPLMPCLYGVEVGAAVLSDLEQGLKLSECQLYLLLKDGSRKAC